MPMLLLKRLLTTALLLNIMILTYLTVIFALHRSAAQQLPDSDKIALIEKALRDERAEDGLNNALDLLNRATASLWATVDLVRHGYYCITGLLIANILLSGVCLHRLTNNR